MVCEVGFEVKKWRNGEMEKRWVKGKVKCTIPPGVHFAIDENVSSEDLRTPDHVDRGSPLSS